MIGSKEYCCNLSFNWEFVKIEFNDTLEDEGEDATEAAAAAAATTFEICWKSVDCWTVFIDSCWDKDWYWLALNDDEEV